ncbi:cytidine deaminase [Aerococcaceae bacterium 50-4]
MNTQALYQLALKHINHQLLRQLGTAGHVACALETTNGHTYTGVCLDLPGSIGLCAEQAAIAEMVKNGETEIKRLVAVYEDGSILPPCGRCREFISQIHDNNIYTTILLPGMRTATIKDLLPEQWDKKWQ